MFFTKTNSRNNTGSVQTNSNKIFQGAMLGNIGNTQNKIATRPKPKPKPLINDQNLQIKYEKIISLEEKLKKAHKHLNNIAKKTDFSNIYEKKKFGDFFNLVTKEELECHLMKIDYNKEKLFLKEKKEKEKEEAKKFSNFISKINNEHSNFEYKHNYDLKSLHRYKCFNQTKIIKNIIINDFGDKKNMKETVLIEFRPMPNLEFLIRNTIIKLPNWNHSIVCGNINYKFIKDICEDICKNTNSKINIVKLDINNLTPSKYSELLTTIDFWNNFTADKILLYQEDTMLFKNNIDDFLEYDYIGAPWPIEQDDNLHGVGNGGFSLRSRKKMIEVIEKVKVKDLKLGNSTKKYMMNTNSTFVPEDVYFSKSLIDYKLGKVATRDVAINFSQETQLSPSPLGGHNFWIAENKISKRYVKTLSLGTSYSKESSHRYGWKNVIQSLENNNIINNDKSKSNFDLIDSMEKYFVWNKYKQTPQRDWYGILHFVADLPNMFRRDEKLDCIFDYVYPSLKNCKGIITLSLESSNNVKDRLKKLNSNVSVYSLKHPIQKIDNVFNIDNFISKNDYTIIQLGKQYRRVTDIFIINSPYKKMWLSGWKKQDNLTAQLKRELDFLNISNANEVNCYYTKTLEEYDELLLNNIIIIPLWNATANNSVLECMQCNIPAWVSRLTSTEQYLGKDYPMFYDNIHDIEPIINNRDLLHKKYIETYDYLTKLDKTSISHEHFNSELLKIINH